MTAVVAAVEQTHAGRSGFSRTTYLRVLAGIAVAVFIFRSLLGARGNFTGDDFDFRELTAGPLNLDMLLYAHNGHMNPVGLLGQWLLQRMFPGQYVPLMVLSAALVAVAAWLLGRWAALVFGYRWQGLLIALMLGTSLMQLESATWWSVALYAAPLLAFSTLLLLMTSAHALGRVPLWLVLTTWTLCLLTSTKAVLLPVLLLGVLAALPHATTAPLGFRRAISTYRRLWLALGGILAVYAVVFLSRRQALENEALTPGSLWSFARLLLVNTFVPSSWGGPWQWYGLGAHNSPAPSSDLQTVSLILAIVAALGLLIARPRVWRTMATSGAFVTISITVVGLGRAGGMLTGPVLRYTTDLTLPVLLVAVAGLAATRWELNPWSPVGQRWNAWLAEHQHVRSALPLVLTMLWIASVTLSHAVPWSTLPNGSVRKWQATARASYPLVSGGLLEQPAPRRVAFLPTPLNRYLVGDPGAPPERQVVLDRFLGFDDEGRLIENYVQGVTAVRPTEDCAYQAVAGQPARVPLEGALGPGRHTVMLEYLMSVTSPVTLGVGGEPVRATLPAGARRAFAVVDGSGDSLTVTVENPLSNMCVMAATVGYVTPGPRVDPTTLS